MFTEICKLFKMFTKNYLMFTSFLLNNARR